MSYRVFKGIFIDIIDANSCLNKWNTHHVCHYSYVHHHHVIQVSWNSHLLLRWQYFIVSWKTSKSLYSNFLQRLANLKEISYFSLIILHWNSIQFHISLSEIRLLRGTCDQIKHFELYSIVVLLISEFRNSLFK
jgi:hypothetical protein